MAPPLTCNLAPGVVVPMPTKVSVVAPFTPLMLPSTRQLLQFTCARAPTALALVRLPAPTLARAPITTLLAPVLLASPAWNPRNVLLSPVVLTCPAPVPKKALLLAAELKPALLPKKELLVPAVFVWPA